ncbi:MAG: beta-glucuronidase [Promethearchaeota archaeon]
MLYPQRNQYRQFIDLSGFWDFKLDPNNIGINENWNKGIENTEPIAVPGSWNDQFSNYRDFMGPAWYQIKFDMPWAWLNGNHVFLRFGSVNYLVDVWLNGEKIGAHEGGHLPFEFDITAKIKQADNLLVLRVDNTLSRTQVPPGGVRQNYPGTNYDFFPFCGIQRPVILYCVPEGGIKDIFIIPSIENNTGIVNVSMETLEEGFNEARFILTGFEMEITEKVSMEGTRAKAFIKVPNAKFWSPETPHLYSLRGELLKREKIWDSCSLNVGIRTFEVKGDKLLLNGKPIYLKGFGRHEDFPVMGRGFLAPLIIKDYSLMKWIGANSFRTSHYPYSEQMMDLADKLGFLVIDETPAVGLTFEKNVIDKHLSLCLHYVEELVKRDRNHPSVIMWSLANEPNRSTKAKEFFKTLHDKVKQLDPTRPVTIVSMFGKGEKAFEFCEVVCMNRYNGWYTQPGQIDEGINYLSSELDEIYEKYKKPVILSEFGADTIPGYHSQPPEMFTEEYQVEFLKKYIKLIRKKPYIQGEHIWNLTDFKTPQGIMRVGGFNYKGVFTRDRQPKLAAHFLRKTWKGEDIFS